MASILRAWMVVFVALGACGSVRAADSIVALSGDPYLASPGGRSLFRDGTWSAIAADHNGDGAVDRVEITNTSPTGIPKTFVFATDEPGRNITVGTYRLARFYQRPGKNLLDFGQEFGFCLSSGHMQGAFTVLAASFDTSGSTPTVKSFAARFAATCPGSTTPIHGYVAYNSDPLPEIATAAYSPTQRTLTLRGPDIALADSILIDGQPFVTRHSSDGSITAKKARLANGTHSVNVAVTTSGYVSPEFALQVGPSDSAPFAHSRLKIVSEPGNFVGGPGGTYRLVKGRFLMTVADYLDDDGIDSLELQYVSTDGSSRWSVALEAWTAGRNFGVGFYPNATGFPVVEGHPGITIFGESRGCQDQTGFFTVTDLAVDRSNAIDQLRWIRVTFDMRCNFTSPPLHGTLEYLAVPLPVIDRIVADGASRELRIEGRNLSSKLRIYVDDQAFDPTSASGDALVLRPFDLLPGLHSIYVATDFPVVSSRPIIVRG